MDDEDGTAVAPADDTHEAADQSQEDDVDNADAPSEDAATPQTVEASTEATVCDPPSSEPSSIPVIQEEKHVPEESREPREETSAAESDTEQEASSEQLDEESTAGSSAEESPDSNAIEATTAKDETTAIENDTVEQEQTDEEEREKLPSRSEEDQPIEQESYPDEPEPMEEEKEQNEEKRETPVQDTGTLIDEDDERTKGKECSEEPEDVATTSFIKHKVNGILTNESLMLIPKDEQRGGDGEGTTKVQSEEIDENLVSLRDEATERRMSEASDEETQEENTEGENAIESTDTADEQGEDMECDEAVDGDNSSVNVKNDQIECNDESSQEEIEIQSPQPLERRLEEDDEERQPECQGDDVSRPEDNEDPRLLGIEEEEEQAESQGVTETLLAIHSQDDESNSLEPRVNGNVSHDEGEEGHETEDFEEPESSGLKKATIAKSSGEQR